MLGLEIICYSIYALRGLCIPFMLASAFRHKGKLLTSFARSYSQFHLIQCSNHQRIYKKTWWLVVLMNLLTLSISGMVAFASMYVHIGRVPMNLTVTVAIGLFLFEYIVIFPPSSSGISLHQLNLIILNYCTNEPFQQVMK